MAVTIAQLVRQRLTSVVTGALADAGVDVDVAVVEGLAAHGFESEAALSTTDKGMVADFVALQLVPPAKACFLGAVQSAGAGPAKVQFESRLAMLESLERTLLAVRGDSPAPFIHTVGEADDVDPDA